MSYNTSRRTRERRLRAKYRKKVWTAAIIMLIIGLVLGFVICVVSAKRSDRVAELLNLGPQTQAEATAEATESPEPEATPSPAPTEAEEVIAAPTLSITQVENTPVSASETEAAEATTQTGMVSFLQSDGDAAESTDAPAIASAPLVTPEATDDASAVAVASVAAEAEPVAEETVEPTAEATAEATVEPTVEPTAVATAEATPEPTVEPTATPEPTVEPTETPIAEPVFVPYGQEYSFDAQITADGKARTSTDETSYETLNLTLKVTAYKDTAYFQENYADSYNLQGNEAAVEFELTLNGYTGSTEIIPQEFLDITLCGDDDGEAVPGFQLMDSEISGKIDVALVSDETTTLYKRYPYDANQGDMTYMSVTAYNDGVASTYLFEIIAPEAEEADGETATDGETASSDGELETLTVGSKGDAVKRLQRVLIDNKLLYGEPDGSYGNYTAEAVKEMQKKLGLEATGVADPEFLEKLYAQEEN